MINNNLMKQRKQLMLLITFLLVFFVGSSQQNFQGKVIYKVAMENLDYSFIEKDSTKSMDVKDMTISILKNIKEAKAILKFTDTESLFEPIIEMKKEGIEGINLTAILAGKGKFYVNNSLKEYLYQKDFMGDLFLITHQPIKWQLSQEEKQIGNYTCYKATTIKTVENRKGAFEREITAWYTPQIPVNFGPKEYNGLPGLILELTQVKLTFSAIKIELNTKEEIIIKKPTKGKRVTEEEFRQIAKEASLSFFGRN